MKLLCAVVLLSGLLSVPAHADPCDVDRIKVCGSVERGDGRVFDCLLGSPDLVTPECYTAALRAESMLHTFRTACKPDAQQWCAQYSGSGKNRMLSCLKDHKQEISTNCKSKYRQLMAFNFDVES
jgi:hypothetical protein